MLHDLIKLLDSNHVGASMLHPYARQFISNSFTPHIWEAVRGYSYGTPLLMVA